MIRQGLRVILQAYPDVSVLGEATNGFEAISNQRFAPRHYSDGCQHAEDGWDRGD